MGRVDNWQLLIKNVLPTRKEVNDFLETGWSDKGRMDLDLITRAVANGAKGEIPMELVGIKSLTAEMLKQPKESYTSKQIEDNFNANQAYSYSLKTHGTHGGSAGQNIMNELVRDMNHKHIRPIINKTLKWMGKPIMDTFTFWTEDDIDTYYERMGLGKKDEEPSNVKITKDNSPDPSKAYFFTPPTEEDNKFYITLYTNHPAYKTVRKGLKKLPKGE